MVDARLARTPAALLVAVEVSILVGPPALRIPAGLMLSLVLPGLAVVPLLSWRRISGAERLLLILGLSIIIAMLAGLVLNAAGVRLTTHSWAAALGLVTAAGLAGAAVKDRSWRPQRGRNALSEDVSDGHHASGELVAYRGRAGLLDGGDHSNHDRARQSMGDDPGPAGPYPDRGAEAEEEMEPSREGGARFDHGRRLVLPNGGVRRYVWNGPMAGGGTLRLGGTAPGWPEMMATAASAQARGRKAPIASLRARGVAISAVLAVAALAASAAGLVISVSGERYRGPGFTELWALPGRSGASPTRLGLISHESHIARYTLSVSVNGRRIRAQDITLRPGQTWQSTQPVGSKPEDLQFVLEKRPNGSVYREVHVLAGGVNG